MIQFNENIEMIKIDFKALVRSRDYGRWFWQNDGWYCWNIPNQPEPHELWFRRHVLQRFF